MNELLEIGKQVLNGGGMAAFIGLLIVIAVPRFKKRIFGNGDISEENTKILADKMRTNHFHEWQEDIKDLKNRIGRMENEMSEMKGEIGYLKGRLNNHE